MRPLLAGLAQLAKQSRCSWIDALASDWQSDDWDAYVTYNEALAAGQAPELSPEREVIFQRDHVRGLFSAHRRTAAQDAHEVIRDALQVVLPGDPIVARAIQRFGRPAERRMEPSLPQPPHRRVTDRKLKEQSVVPADVKTAPAEILAITKGRRALVAGGQGSREAHRAAIEKSLQLEELQWVYGERGKAAHFNALRERMRPGRYDLVFLLASHSGHCSSGLVEACRTANIPLIYLARGYSVVSVIDAIRQQVVARKVPEWMEGALGR